MGAGQIFQKGGLDQKKGEAKFYRGTAIFEELYTIFIPYLSIYHVSIYHVSCINLSCIIYHLSIYLIDIGYCVHNVSDESRLCDSRERERDFDKQS